MSGSVKSELVINRSRCGVWSLAQGVGLGSRLVSPVRGSLAS